MIDETGVSSREILTDYLTLSQQGEGADYNQQMILAPPDFKTFRRPCYVINNEVARYRVCILCNSTITYSNTQLNRNLPTYSFSIFADVWNQNFDWFKSNSFIHLPSLSLIYLQDREPLPETRLM